MRVSIIISVYNCLDLTKVCIESLEETLPADLDHEVILIDDGSKDGSQAYLQEFVSSRPKWNFLFNEENLGFARSNNKASQLANGSHLLFLNNDTKLTQGWIEPMIDAYRVLGSKKPGMVGNVQRRFSDEKIDHAGVFVNSRGKPDHLQIDPAHTYPQKLYSEQLATTGACFLIPAELFAAVGRFDTEFQNGGEDMDLNFKVRKAGYSVFVANKSCIWHHVSASPGRNDHHERNTRIVFRRWRNLLLTEGARTWGKEYASNPENKGKFWSEKAYRQSVMMVKGWRKQPPEAGMDYVETLICEQEAVWKDRFGE